MSEEKELVREARDSVSLLLATDGGLREEVHDDRNQLYNGRLITLSLRLVLTLKITLTLTLTPRLTKILTPILTVRVTWRTS